MFKKTPSLSIARRIQFQIGLVIAVVIACVTLLAYQNSIHSMREEVLDSLFSAITQRSNHDSAAFVEAQQNTYQLRNEYLRRLAMMGAQDPKAEFDEWFSRYPDGLVRVRKERDDHKHLPSIYIRENVALTPAIRRQVVIAFRLLREWGPAMTTRYYSAYIDLPGVALIMYSPSVNWGKEADKTTNNFDYPPVKNSSPFNNPLRQNLWTEVYWDDKALIYMVSTITPTDFAGEWIGTVSQDLSVDELVKRTIGQQIPGTYNLLLGDDGRLIAHPDRMEEIAKAGGNLKVSTLNDPLLSNVTELAMQAGMYPEVRESADGQYYLGLSRIRGPNWHLVTVYPKALLQTRAYASAQVILLGGLVGLVVQLVLLAWIIRRQVAVPLGRLSQAAASIAKGDLQVELDDREGHELGRLARNFIHMASRLRERDEALTNRARELEHEVSERISSEHRMQHMATHDALTGLANRTLLMDRLQQALAAGVRNQQVIAVLFIDLDNFKQINDTLGHDAGDEVLRHVAGKVSLLLRKSDTLSRMGGDEFVLLLPAIGRKEDAMVIAEKIIASLSEVIEVGGVNFAITPSIGISSFPYDGDDAQTLLKNADIAMYRAKEYGRNGFQCYTPDMGQRASEVLPMEVAIRAALSNHELELYFQPKVDARTHTIVSAEALLRWSRPGFGLLSPGAFIPFAEERANLMRAIDTYVLRKACMHLARWRKAGVPVTSIALNLSASQFARAGMIAELDELLLEFGLDGSLLTLEVTEGVLLAEGGVAADNMLALRRMGVQVSIDDFGTGFSSLSYLHRFPVDELKIDRSFVSKIGRTGKDAALVKAIIGLGRDLSLRVVAEGVETTEQAEYLTSSGCDVLQGYLFYLPMSEEQFLEMLGAQAFASA
ncbi:bifunctional diguanylate cyclase/phosphodiesterase [Rhodoferax aquaticus]|uniref:EAL domain-containing protein n=1 Tax=Rhodoferax aquaticus TaxID=2527691 RepID=A0A515EMT3_9BURK|nr:EAL domain-containing protein [Rhodoferax aquaticus]QDL53986.1 EAL domain-containing protein [Rhodoferax aquaticus]